MPQYLDENGNPIAAPAKVYLDDNGEPIKQPVTPTSTDPSGRTPTGEPAPDDTRNALQRWLDNLITPDPRREEWQSPGRNMADTFARGVAENVVPLVSHPLKSVGGILRTGAHAIADNPGNLTGVASDFFVKPLVEQGVSDYQTGGLAKAVPHMAGTGVGLWATGELGGEGLRKTGKVLKGASGRVGEMLTKTGPRETAKLVKETQAENAEAVTKAAEKTEKERAKVAQQNAEQEQGRKLDLRKHFEKTQATKAANEAAEAPVARKEALNRGVEELDPRAHDELVQTEKTVNEQANEKYTALRKVLKNEESGMYQPKDEEGHIQGEPVSVPQRLFDAADESMRGSDTAPTIVKDLGKRVRQGETSLSYNDLQGYREEIGRELRKGTLPPDVYNAYKKMMPMIDDAMQEIADRHGLGKAQTDARSFYREYAQTFLDRDSPVRAAIDTGKSIGRKPGSVVNALQGRNAALEALARYNPELARKLNTIRGYQAEARGISAKPKPGKLLPKLEPKPAPIPEPAPVKPEVKTIGPEEIRGAKTQGLEQRANIIRRRGEWIATGAAGYRALSNILHGNLAAVPPDLLEGGIAVAGVEGVARLLENPKVVEFLTRPTARDLAQVPPELRGDMSTIAQVAARKGIKVDPRIYAIAGAAAPKKTPGDILREEQ